MPAIPPEAPIVGILDSGSINDCVSAAKNPHKIKL